MPITKQDVLGFGTTLKETLTTWGEQIQYGRDMAKLEKVQKDLSNVKNFTTNEKGEPLGYEDIARKMMNINTQLGDIRTPQIMELGKTNVAQFMKANFTGLGQRVQNTFDQGVDAIQNPADAKNMKSLTDSLPDGMYQYKAGVPSKYYASKIINEAIIGEDGAVDKQFVNQFALVTNTRGGVEKVFLGKIDRVKANVMEQQQMQEREFQNRIDVKSTLSRSSSYNFSDRPPSFDLIEGEKGTGVYNDRSGKVSYDGGKTWETATGIKKIVGTTEQKNSVDNLQVKYKEANDVITNRFTKSEIEILYEQMDNGNLFSSQLWNRLSDYEKNLIRGTLLSDYSEDVTSGIIDRVTKRYTQ